MQKRRQILYALGLVASSLLVFTNCKPTTSTDGSFNPGNRGRTATASLSSINVISNGSSIVPARILVTLKSAGNIAMTGIVPSFTVTNPGANDSMQCPATDVNGNAICTMTSYITTARTLLLTSPISVTGGTIQFSQASNQMSITTQPSLVGGTLTNSIAGNALIGAPVVTLLDPLGAVSSNDQTSIVYVTLNTITNTSTNTPQLSLNGLACSGVCTAQHAINGVVDFGIALNRLSVNTSGTYSLTFSASGMASVTTSQFNVVNNGADHIIFSQEPQASVAPNQAFSPEPIVEVVDASGNLVTTGCVGGLITMTLTSGAGSLQGVTVKSVVGGYADYKSTGLNIDPTAAGSNFQLTATLSGCAGVTTTTVTSSFFTVTTVGISAQLAFSVQPSAITTNTLPLQQQPVVQILDASGTLVTTDQTSIVTLDTSLCAAAGIAINAPNAVTAISGVATFTGITLSGAVTKSNCSLLAKATGASTIASVASENIVVGPAGTTSLALTWANQPDSVGVSQNILSSGTSLLVNITDGLGNVVTGDSSTQVVITATGGTGTLSGTTTKRAVNGVASFSDLKLSAVGAYTLTATVTGLTSASTNSFVISTLGVASNLVFTQQPVSESAGVKFSIMPKVTVEDDFGNSIPSAGIPVTLSCTYPTGCAIVGLPITVSTGNTGIASVADFSITGSSLKLNTPVGNNLQLTASASGLRSGVTPTPIVLNAGSVANTQSSIASTCPSAVATNDGIIVVFALDQFANPVIGVPVIVATSSDCAAPVCSYTGSDGKSQCSFSCPTTGYKAFSVSSVNGSATTPISKTTTCLQN